jgi:hypothetical protein
MLDKIFRIRFGLLANKRLTDGCRLGGVMVTCYDRSGELRRARILQQEVARQIRTREATLGADAEDPGSAVGHNTSDNPSTALYVLL